jgi:RNA polymerase primary sigma factor
LPLAPAAGESFEQYLRDIKDLPMITDIEEERALARKAREGDQVAAERLVTANLRFVIAFVKRYQGHGLELGDLVAIGNEGLLRAVRKFDPDRGVKFISYAVWWVRQAVLKALAEQTRSVRFPLNQNTAVVRFAKAQGLLAQELGRTPTDEELATALTQSVEEIREAKRLFVTEVSLDAPVDSGDTRSATLGERLPMGESSEIESHTDESLRREFLDRLFRRYLTPRERRILSLYYGLDPQEEARTLEEIGTALGVTRERIRQLRERAFAKLRDCPEVRHLGEFRAA